MISSPPVTRAAAVLALVGSAAWSGMRASRPTPPRVSVEGGMLEGSVDSATGVVVFRGIPYAAPPVGRLRWRPPERAPRWSGVRRADQLGKNCVQTQIYGDIDPFAAGVSEDCLYLNVWTTELSATAARRPVMVWIHGGGFRAGFGGEERHNGARLAQKGAVVVTLNYRLGPLGFLAHPALAAESPRHSSGNYGLLDQIAALQWVRRNISRFGGDPARVTIFGESAGGMSVGALIASPLAKGLFHRAILESGTGIGFGIRGRDSAFAQGVRFAELLGAAGRGRNAAAQLRATNAETLFAALRPPPNGPPPNPLAFLPVVDGWVLPLPVDSALVQRRANLVPVIVGSNGDEDAGVFGAPARAFARLVAARQVPAYLYLFTRAGEDSASRARGAYHSAEITFVFGRPRPLLESAGHAAYDSTLAEAMSDYWVAFATSGDPNGPPAAGRWPRWPEYDSAREAYMELGPEVAARTEPRKALYDSLDNIARSRGGIRP
jgi:para-nitrobenzyl esterase